MLCFCAAECLKTAHSPTEEPQLHQKRSAQPFYHIFTSSPISSCFKKPIFKVKTSSDSSQHLETSNHSENKENQLISSPQKKSEVDTSSKIQVEPPHNVESSTGTTPPACESEPPSACDLDEEQEDEDQTVFFTPELFEDDSNESSSQKEMWPSASPRSASPVLVSELFGLAKAEGQAFGFDGQGAISVSEESTELPQGQKGGIRGLKEGEEGEQVDSQSRLSRSRQNTPSTPTGN